MLDQLQTLKDGVLDNFGTPSFNIKHMKILIVTNSPYEAYGVIQTLLEKSPITLSSGDLRAFHDSYYRGVMIDLHKKSIGLCWTDEGRDELMNITQNPFPRETKVNTGDLLSTVLERIQSFLDSQRLVVNKEDIVSFDYVDPDLRSTHRIVIVKESNKTLLKGLDLKDSYQFKSFTKTRIKNLRIIGKQVVGG